MKKLLKPLLGLLLLVLLVGLIANLLIRRQLTPENLKTHLEAEIAANVTLGEVKLSPFLFPNRVSLQQVTLAMSGKPSGQIPANFPPAIQAEEITLAVKFLPLLKKELNIKEFTLKKPALNFVLYKDGGNSLEDLFEEPFAETKPEGEGADSDEVETEKNTDKDNELNRFGGFLARLDSARLVDGQANIHLEKSGSTIAIENLNLDLHDIAVDLGAIEKTNHADLDLSGKISFQSSKSTLPPYFGIHLSGPAKVRLFDPKTKELAPDVQARFKISEDSYLDTQIPVLQKAMSQVQKLEKLGLKISGLPPKATFGRPGETRELAGHYQNGLLTLKKSLSILYGDWELQLSPESWVHTQSESEEDHQLKASLFANKGLSQSLQKRFGKLDKYLPKELRGGQEKLSSSLFTNDRLQLKLNSSGELSSPKVRLDHELPDLPVLENLNLNELNKDDLKEQAKEKAKSLLKGLFD